MASIAAVQHTFGIQLRTNDLTASLQRSTYKRWKKVTSFYLTRPLYRNEEEKGNLFSVIYLSFSGYSANEGEFFHLITRKSANQNKEGYFFHLTLDEFRQYL